MRPVVFCFLLLATLHVSQAQPLFREVRVTRETWEITFPAQGSRFHLEIDGFSRGSSGYLQRLRLKTSEKLRLIEKHHTLEISPAKKDGKDGIEIVTHYRDRQTGETKRKVRFEENHGVDDKTGND